MLYSWSNVTYLTELGLNQIQELWRSNLICLVLRDGEANACGKHHVLPHFQ